MLHAGVGSASPTKETKIKLKVFRNTQIRVWGVSDWVYVERDVVGVLFLIL